MRLSVTACCLLLFACSSSKAPGPTPVEVYSTGVPGQAAAQSLQRVTATVLAVDKDSRMITLKGEDGHTETMSVPPEVTRLKEVVAGDVVVVEVKEGILFEYQPPGSPAVQPQAVVAGGRTDRSQAPGAGVAAAVQATVTVMSIDMKNRIVEFQGPNGNKYHVKAEPKLALEKLAVGDRMLATYATTVAITIDKK